MALATGGLPGLYQRLKRNPALDMRARNLGVRPRYALAKLIINLINSVDEVIEADHQIERRLMVVFFSDFNVKAGQHIYPAADLSEQISTAAKEASGTGNMKLAMNGALTIGTLDAANIEIRNQVGAENFFLLGLSATGNSNSSRSAKYGPSQDASTCLRFE